MNYLNRYTIKFNAIHYYKVFKKQQRPTLS